MGYSDTHFVDVVTSGRSLDSALDFGASANDGEVTMLHQWLAKIHVANTGLKQCLATATCCSKPITRSLTHDNEAKVVHAVVCRANDCDTAA